MNIFKSVINNIFVKNIFLATVIVAVLIFCTLWWLDAHTHHGEAVKVPDVKGLQIAEAIPFLEKAQLRYEIVDSIHVKNAKPGSIVEVIPPVGSIVKTNRIVFITINSFSIETLIAPDVKDLSQRQALVMLKTMGFENVVVKYVPSSYKDLVIGLEYNGREVRSGERIPVVGQLTLSVSSGESEDSDTEDSTDIEQPTTDKEDSWF